MFTSTFREIGHATVALQRLLPPRGQNPLELTLLAPLNPSLPRHPHALTLPLPLPRRLSCGGGSAGEGPGACAVVVGMAVVEVALLSWPGWEVVKRWVEFSDQPEARARVARHEERTWAALCAEAGEGVAMAVAREEARQWCVVGRALRVGFRRFTARCRGLFVPPCKRVPRLGRFAPTHWDGIFAYSLF